MKDILGIDPGPAESAFALVTEDQQVLHAEKVGNDSLIERIREAPPAHVAIESIQSYGMAVGREVFDTCFFIGELIRACKDAGIPFTLYPRPEYTRRICGAGKVNDSVIRQALELRFGGYGENVSSEVIPDGEPGAGVYKGGPRKGQSRVREVRTPQPLHALNCSDKRSAFTVAVYHLDVVHHLPAA
jgi:Holliday junction resolvasome RuvABC endonuclease subunit